MFYTLAKASGLMRMSPKTFLGYMSRLETYEYKAREELQDNLSWKRFYTLEEVKMVHRSKELVQKEGKSKYDAAQQVVEEWKAKQEEELESFLIRISNETQEVEELEQVQEELIEKQSKRGFWSWLKRGE
ncbi:hypothetical protein [Bacillus cereus group sp. Bce004]|uniref:hypothetical protein n=1 Tax=Bacillus cereus group sp. Bce004 TaxID=3445257 RepID=UPI003F1E7BCB